MQDHVHAEGPCLFGAAGPIYRQVAVEPGLVRDADHFAVYLTQDNAVVLTDIGHQVQHAFQLLLAHKARCAVGALVGVDQVTLPVVCPRLAVPHPHDHEDQHSERGHTAAQTIQAVGPAEHSGNTGEEIAVRKFRGRTENSARRLPYIVVVQELSNVPAPIEQGSQGGGYNEQQFYKCSLRYMKSLQKCLLLYRQQRIIRDERM